LKLSSSLEIFMIRIYIYLNI